MGLSPHALLPNLTKNLTTQLFFAGLAIAFDTFVRADNRHAQAIKHRAQLLVTAINPAARRADPANRLDHTFTVVAVFEINADVTLGQIGGISGLKLLAAFGRLGEMSNLIFKNVALLLEGF